MMEWRELRQNGLIYEHLPAIWKAERAMPRWFRDAAKTFTRSLPEYVTQIDTYAAVHGLFDGDQLVLAVYFEPQEVQGLQFIHLSVLDHAKAATADAVAQMRKLRDRTLTAGARIIRCWPLRKNRGVIAILNAIDFASTGLFMDLGQSRGRILRWEMMEVRRALR